MTLEQFVDKLLEDKGLSELDVEVKKEMANDLLERLNNHINAGLLEALPPEKLEELGEVTANESAKEDAVQTFFAENVPDFQQTFTVILASFRKTYLGL